MELKEIIKMAEEAEALEAEINTQDDLNKERKVRLRALMEQTIPSAMLEDGMTDFGLKSGVRVEIKQLFAVSLPAMGSIFKATGAKKKELMSRLRKGLTWLRKNKGGDMIKNTVSCDFSAGEDAEAKAVFKYLREQKLHPIAAQTVHSGSLKSFLREKWNNDVEIPDMFDMYIGQVAVFILPKPAKKKAGSKSAKS